MPVPSYDKFLEPVLRYLATCPDGVLARDAYEAAAQALGLTESEKQELVPSGVQPIFKNRAGWAHDRLKRAGLSSSTRRGFWKLTEKGFLFAKEHGQPLSIQTIEELTNVNRDIRIRDVLEAVHSQQQAPQTEQRSIFPQSKSPDDRLEEALAELRRNVVADLLEALEDVSPAYFETVVLDLLHKMGYGTSRADLQRVGGSGDGGIDGVISLDRLGLEKVYVQAKRWNSPVGRPEVQAFYGALAGQRANKGVFITTSTFTAQAISFAGSVERVVLVDGQRLAELMIDHEVGVSLRPLKVPKIDMDYFNE